MRKIIPSIIVFTCLTIDNVTAQYWSALGAGIGYPDGLGTVYTLAMYDGELYAAGNHTYESGTAQSKILKWDGNNWLTIGEATNNLNETAVYSFAVFDGELYVAGNFSMINNVSANSLAKWNGTTWSPVGSGMGSASVTSLTVLNNELYATGMFDTVGSVAAKNIAKWNGATWLPVGNVLMDYVSSLAVYNGELHASGIYYDANNTYNSDIIKWDGTNWIPLNCQSDGGFSSMIEHNGELYVGGNFTSIGGISANNIAKWNGANWSATGLGLGFPGSSIQGVFSLTIHKNSIHAAGFFTTTDGTSCKNIAKWDGNSWIGLGNGVGQNFEEEVYAIISDDTVLYTGGNFNTAGNVFARHIAKWKDQCTTVPVQPGNINGETIGCQGNYLTYSVYPVNDAAGYIWTLPSGWSGSSFSNSISALTDTSEGIITVIAHNPCGISEAQTLAYTVKPIPLRPGPINGNDTICQGFPQIYSIDSVPAATSYTWTIPAGWSVLSGSSWGSSSTPHSIILTTNYITVKSNDKSGNMFVTANNGCGSSHFQTIDIYVNHPPQLVGAISGDVIANMGQVLIYSINPEVGITDYIWSLNGVGTIISGQGTNSISVKWETPGDFTLSVTLNHSCGTIANQKVNIKVMTHDAYPYEINLIPNPSSGEFYLKIKRVQDRVINVAVLNMAGQLVFGSRIRQGTNDYSQLIRLDKMAIGLYAVKIMIDDKVFVKSVMINH